MFRIIKEIVIIVIYEDYKSAVTKSIDENTWFYPLFLMVPFFLDVFLTAGFFYSVLFYTRE